MAVLTRKQIDEANDLVTRRIPVPEWGGDVIIRSAMSADQVAYEHSLVATRIVDDKPQVVSDFTNEQARLVVRCLVDEAGNRLYADEDAPVLGKKNAAVIERLFNAIKDLSKMSAGSVAAAEKNSAATPAAASRSS
jgi:hypothetical protein